MFNRNGSLRDLLCGAKPKQSFFKKYGNPKGHKPLTVDQISIYGRQILEALKFLHDKGLPYGELNKRCLRLNAGFKLRAIFCCVIELVTLVCLRATNYYFWTLLQNNDVMLKQFTNSVHFWSSKSTKCGVWRWILQFKNISWVMDVTSYVYQQSVKSADNITREQTSGARVELQGWSGGKGLWRTKTSYYMHWEIDRAYPYNCILIVPTNRWVDQIYQDWLKIPFMF